MRDRLAGQPGLDQLVPEVGVGPPEESVVAQPAAVELLGAEPLADDVGG